MTGHKEDEQQQVRVYQYFDWGRDCYHNCTESEYLGMKSEDRRIGWATLAKPEYIAGEQS